MLTLEKPQKKMANEPVRKKKYSPPKITLIDANSLHCKDNYAETHLYFPTSPLDLSAKKKGSE